MNIFELNKEEIKRRLIFQVDNYKKVEEEIQERDLAYERVEDLVKLYCVDLTGARIMLTAGMMRDLGVDFQEVKDLAMNNMPQRMPARVQPLADVIGEMVGMGDIGPAPGSPMIVMCSNNSGVMGAGTIFYPGIEEKIRDVVGADFYILPSSVHEVLAVPKVEMSLKELRDMVTTINAAQVAPEEQLSNNIYEFSDGKIRIALTEREKNYGKTSINRVKRIAGQRRGSDRQERPGRGNRL